MSCYTLLRGFRLPWPPSSCLYQSTPFRDLKSPELRTLTRLTDHPVLPVLLTKKGPLIVSHFQASKFTEGTWLFLAYLEFESWTRNTIPRCHQSLSLPDVTNAFDDCYPERNFGGNQLLDSSMSLSPLYPALAIDLHVRTATDLHQAFAWLHPGQV